MNEWQTIDTAPKNGDWFIAYRDKSKLGTWNRVVIVRWHDETEDFVWLDDGFDIYCDDIDDVGEDGNYLFTPYESRGSLTHWIPLPDPPKP